MGLIGRKFRQSTLNSKVTFKGVGLHTGTQVCCSVYPAPENTGIVFVRSDRRGAPKIPADISQVVRTDFSTTLGSQGETVSTVEHLLAALVGIGIFNAIVELDGPEVPILDGSSKEFSDAFVEAGTRYLSAPQKFLKLRKSIKVVSGDKSIEAKPSNQLSIRAKIEFPHELIGQQVFSFGSGDCFRREIASARTFGFLKEVEFLHKNGLAKGGSLENAIVLDEARVLNPDGLRFHDEFVRHKILDSLGDFALLGVALRAEVEVNKSGHHLHAAFLKKVLSDPKNFEIVEGNPSSDRVTNIQEESIALIAAAV